MKVWNEINNFYYKMALYELQIMNEKDYYNGLSYNSILYINVISQTEDYTISKLAKMLHVTKSAATLKINELVKAGAVCKMQSKEDKRVFYIRLSDKMKQTIQIYDDVFIKIEKELTRTYSLEQLASFSEILHAISGYAWRELEDE